MAKRRNAKGRRESGTFTLLPHSLLRHENFGRLSPRATKLFLDIATNYNGSNNGDFSIAWSRMKDRGWRSKDQLYKALHELVGAGFAIQSRQGGKHKCSLYALTLWPVDGCKGKLDIPETRTASNEWKNRIGAPYTDHISPPRVPIRVRNGNVVSLLARHEDQSA